MSTFLDLFRDRRARAFASGVTPVHRQRAGRAFAAAIAGAALAATLAAPSLAAPDAAVASAQAAPSPPAVVAPAAASAPVVATPALTAADYARPPLMSGYRVSPDNRHAAVIVQPPGGRASLVVVDLAEPTKRRTVAAWGDVDVRWVRWVNDRRLVFEVQEPGTFVHRDGVATLAADIDGGRQQRLITWRTDNDTTGTRIRDRALTYGWEMLDTVRDGSDDIIVVKRLGEDNDARRIARMNTVTATTKPVAESLPRGVRRWIFDDRGELRVVSTVRDGRERLHGRSDGGGDWVVVADHDANDARSPTPLMLEGDGTLVVAASPGTDTTGLYVYDLKARRLDPEPLVAVAGFDVGGGIERDDAARRVVGVHGVADTGFSVWFDDGLAAAQRVVDAALPAGRVNRLYCGNCVGARWLLVASSSDRHSGEVHVFDRETRKLTALGAARPWLPEATQGRRSFHRVPARDGLPLPVVVTHPVGAAAAQPLPAVVLVHGGPWIRGATLDWSAWPQFLASRGWRVLEVDFRGSTGLGSKHFTAGWRQWGQAMQDDLVDALDWAIGERLVDRDRVCVFGASYGGYAALLAPARDPGRWRCAASFAGVTDIDLMFNDWNSDLTVQSREYALKRLVGDPKADAEMFRRHSPVHRLDDVKVPLFLAQGSFDSRVTEEHFDRFVSAARRKGLAVETALYREEVHGFNDPANEADFLRRLEAFLAKSLQR